MALTRGGSVDFRTLEALRKHNAAWKLLAADKAPFTIAFLYDAFTKPNRRTLSQSELTTKLDDLLYSVRLESEENEYPRQAEEYLNDWVADQKGWLRKFYVEGSDEPHFDITPAVEKVIEWLHSLETRQFVGTESRLKTIFDLLRQVARGAETDAAVRIAELETQRAEIEAQIARIHRGELDLMDDTQLKERFYLIEQGARALLADFRQVEQNFRELDRSVRERCTLWDGNKGELLEAIFGDHDIIADSDQGKSFRAFWDFLLSPARQEEMSRLLERTLSLKAITEIHPDQRLLRIHFDWLEAGDAALRTVARLSEQLRKYLDDQAWLENRRIMTIIHEIEHHAVTLRDSPPEEDIIELSDTAPTIALPMERPLFSPPLRTQIEQQTVESGKDDADASALFEQVYVDKAELQARIRQALQSRSQITLQTLVEEFPLEKGLAELVTYMSLAADDKKTVIDDSQTETISWVDSYNTDKQATLPMIIFSR